MPRDVTEPNEHETGFGTGLRPRLELGRISAEAKPQLEQPAAAEEQADEERSEVEELWVELESALEREAGLRKAVAEYGQLQARAADLEHALAVRESELADLRALLEEETRPKQEES